MTTVGINGTVHECSFPVQPPHGSLHAPGPCGCGKTWERAQAERILEKAVAAMNATEPPGSHASHDYETVRDLWSGLTSSAGDPGRLQPPAYARTPEQSALLALVDAHFFGDGPWPLQLVCMTEDAHDVECGTTIALVEPGTEWDRLEEMIAAHAAECHAPARQQDGIVIDVAPPPGVRVNGIPLEDL
jgi:hypothetical protein